MEINLLIGARKIVLNGNSLDFKYNARPQTSLKSLFFIDGKNKILMACPICKSHEEIGVDKMVNIELTEEVAEHADSIMGLVNIRGRRKLFRESRLSEEAEDMVYDVYEKHETAINKEITKALESTSDEGPDKLIYLEIEKPEEDLMLALENPENNKVLIII